VIEELGEGVTGYAIGERVLVGAITPCGERLDGVMKVAIRPNSR